MSRQARRLSNTGLYHIIFRGINRKNIFEEENDYEKMIEMLGQIKNEKEFNCYAYCLMNNHVHLLICEKEIGDISNIMQRLLTRYAGWYNKKYSRSGTLFGDRYKSEPVEKDNYLLSLIRYIHQNPKKAGLVSQLQDYKWSSYHNYIKENRKNMVETTYILKMLSSNKRIARKSFIDFHNVAETKRFEINNNRRKTEEQVRKIIIDRLEGKEPHTIGNLPKEKRNRIIKELRQKEALSIRQIERATGISRGIISRIYREEKESMATNKMGEL